MGTWPLDRDRDVVQRDIRRACHLAVAREDAPAVEVLLTAASVPEVQSDRIVTLYPRSYGSPPGRVDRDRRRPAARESCPHRRPAVIAPDSVIELQGSRSASASARSSESNTIGVEMMVIAVGAARSMNASVSASTRSTRLGSSTDPAQDPVLGEVVVLVAHQITAVVAGVHGRLHLRASPARVAICQVVRVGRPCPARPRASGSARKRPITLVSRSAQDRPPVSRAAPPRRRSTRCGLRSPGPQRHNRGLCRVLPAIVRSPTVARNACGRGRPAGGPRVGR